MARVAAVGSGEVDFSVLKAYARGDDSFVRDVLALFRTEAAGWAPSLDPEAPDWRAVVHTMKGTSRTVGARSLGDLCEQAERDGAVVLPAIQASLQAALDEIEAYLGEAT